MRDLMPAHRVIKNITHLCSRSRSKMWGPEGWKKVVVCVVSDGRSKINKRTLQVLTLVCPQIAHSDDTPLLRLYLDGLLCGRSCQRYSRGQRCHSPHIRVNRITCLRNGADVDLVSKVHISGHRYRNW